MSAGLVILLIGLALFAFGVFSASALPFFASAAVLGAGHGLAYLGSQEPTDAIAPRDQRAEVFSGFQLGLYAGATVPAIGVGFAARAIGLAPATLAFVGAVAAFAIGGLVWLYLVKPLDPAPTDPSSHRRPT
jgi:hypothetical protein